MLKLILFLVQLSFGTPISVVTISDSINPGSADYLIDKIGAAEKAGDPFLVVVLDTPGGLLGSTHDTVKRMLNSTIPIVVFVSPKGARAASAGALIMLASDVAAMAPGTHIGAAHPVQMGGQEEQATPMDEKIVNDTASFAESLAKLKGRNTEWAIQSVRKSDSIIGEKALERNVIDLMADDLEALLKALSGRHLRKAKGQIISLPKDSFEPRMETPSIKHRVVSFFSDPNVAYLIMSLGGLCIWVELSSPGLIVPGVLGVLCVVLSLVSFQMMPISYGALAFMVLGLVGLILEALLPTFGILGVGGLVSFIFGSLFLMDTSFPEMRISLSVILPTAAVLVSAVTLIGFLVMKSRKAKPRSGLEALVGEFGEAREEIGAEEGKVFVQGELWSAVSTAKIPKGHVVVVKATRGMSLVVEPRGEKHGI